MANTEDYEDYDDYYDDDAAFDGFEGYIPKTNSTGAGMMAFVLVFTILPVLLLPVLVILGERYEQRRKAFMEGKDQSEGVNFDEEEEENNEEEHDKDVDKTFCENPSTPDTNPLGPGTPDPLKDGSFDGEGEEKFDNEIQNKKEMTSVRKRIRFPFTMKRNGKKKDGNNDKNDDDTQSRQSSKEDPEAQQQQQEVLEDNPVEVLVANEVGFLEVESATPVGTPVTPPKQQQQQNQTKTTASAIGRHNEVPANNVRPMGGYHHRSGGTNRRGARSTVSGAMSGTGSAVSGISRLNRAAATAFDRIVIPTYPDDDPEYRSTVSGRGNNKHARSTLSTATTSRLFLNNGASSEVASNINGRTPTILDANGRMGGVGRRRHHHHRRRQPIGRIETIHKAIEQEDKASAVGNGAEWTQQERLLVDNHCDLRSGVSQTQTAELRNRMQKREKKTVVSGAASSVLNDDDEDDQELMAQQRQAAWDMHHLPVPRSRLSGRGGSTAISAQSGYTASDIKSALKAGEQYGYVDDITPNDAADADDPGREVYFQKKEEYPVTILFGPGALWRPRTIQNAFDALIDIAEPDAETRRILKLAVPFTLSEVMGTLFDALQVIVIARNLGTDVLTSAVVTEILIGLTDELLQGVNSAQDTICAHAVGAGNNYLAGQYIQICAWTYSILSIPFLVMWAFIMDDAMLFLGLSPSIAQMSLDYTRVLVFSYYLSGIGGCFYMILDITGHENFGLYIDIVGEVIELAVLMAVVIPNPNTTLVTIGLISLVIQIVISVFYFGWALYNGWFRPFWKGMFRNLALKNKPAVKNLLSTALPLSVGTFLEYGEWELLTFFIAYMGPAEVATWSLLGSVWELFEAATNGLSGAAGVRVAYHLGKGNPMMAKISSYKSLFMSVIVSFFVTSIFFMCGRNLATWFTKDPTLQHMLNDCIPLVGIGNITMTFGMVSWGLIGAQGRFRLATCIMLLSSWLVTIPMALIVVFGMGLDLKSIVGSIVVGYSVAGTAMAYVMIRSDWERLSKIIVELNAMTGMVESDDSDEESDSSSSSSSSSSDSSDSDSSDSDDSDSDSDSESGDDQVSELRSATGTEMSKQRKLQFT